MIELISSSLMSKVGFPDAGTVLDSASPIERVRALTLSPRNN
jgi:hypothetical protein